MAKNKIFIDEIVKEIMKDDDEYLDSILYELYMDKIVFAFKEISETYSINEFIEKYVANNRENEFYYEYKDENSRRVDLSDSRLDNKNSYDRIHNQIIRTFKTKSEHFKNHGIPKEYVDNVRLLLRYYNHPYQKKIRNKKLDKISFLEMQDYVNNLKEERKNESYINYIIEKSINIELYKNICKIKDEIDSMIAESLINLRFENDIIKRLDYIKEYKRYLIKANNIWNEKMEDRRITKNNVRLKCINSILNIKEEFDSEDKEYELDIKDKNLIEQIEKKFNSQENYNEIIYKKDFNKEDFKLIMKKEKENSDKIINFFDLDDIYYNHEDDDQE